MKNTLKQIMLDTIACGKLIGFISLTSSRAKRSKHPAPERRRLWLIIRVKWLRVLLNALRPQRKLTR